MAFILLFETAGYVFSLPPLQIKDKGMPYVMTWLDLDWGSRSELFGVKLHLNLPLSHAGSEHCNVQNPNSSTNFIIVIWSITRSIKRKFNCQDQSHLRLGREGRSLYERLRSLWGRSPLTVASSDNHLIVFQALPVQFLCEAVNFGPNNHFSLRLKFRGNWSRLLYHGIWFGFRSQGVFCPDLTKSSICTASALLQELLYFLSFSAVSWKILQTLTMRTVQSAWLTSTVKPYIAPCWEDLSHPAVLTNN